MDTLHNPGDYYQAIKNTLNQTLHTSCHVGSYAEYGRLELKDTALVLIEFEQSTLLSPNHEGRLGHQFEMVLHAIVSGQYDQPEIKALNLAAYLERVIVHNTWGLPSNQVVLPDEIRTVPGGFDRQHDIGYESWCVLFSQTIYLGPSELEANPPVKAVWWANNPKNPADEKAYERFHD